MKNLCSCFGENNGSAAKVHSNPLKIGLSRPVKRLNEQNTHFQIHTSPDTMVVQCLFYCVCIRTLNSVSLNGSSKGPHWSDGQKRKLMWWCFWWDNNFHQYIIFPMFVKLINQSICFHVNRALASNHECSPFLSRHLSLNAFKWIFPFEKISTQPFVHFNEIFGDAVHTIAVIWICILH